MANEPFVITISHQVGSGGAKLGKMLSERLAIPFIDREILQRVAQQLCLPEAELENREERLSSFWQSLARVAVLTDPAMSLSTNKVEPTDRELYELESEYIGCIAQQTSAIIIGRCGRYILRDHPRHVAVLVHAPMPARVKRVCELYHWPENEAQQFIRNNDKERTAYVRSFTKEDWLDARLYDFCLNTTSVKLDNAVDVIMACIEAKVAL